MYSWVGKFFNWIIRIFRWFFLDAKYGILVLLTFPFIIFICWLFLPEWEATIRISGMLFQLLGLSTVVVGLVGKKKLFGSQSVVNKVQLWIGQFPKFQQQSKPLIIRMDPIQSGSTCSVNITSSSPDNATLEERIALLETAVTNIDNAIYQTNQSIETNITEVKSEIKTEKDQRIQLESRSNQLIQEAVSGSFVMEEVGVLWLFFGILMASASVEISGFIA